MPERETTLEPWREIQALVEQQRASDLLALLDTLSPGEVARALTRLNDEERQRLLILLEPEEAADLLEGLVEAQGADIIEDMPAVQAAAIVDEMESDHRADLLGEMDEDDAEAILRRMDPEEAEDARNLLRYDEDTAGGVMVTDFAVYPQDSRVGDVIKDMRENAEVYSDYGVQYAYVQSERGTLIGVLRLRDLLLAPAQRPIREIMVANPIYVLADTSVDELDHFFDRYPFWCVPVTDEDGHMVGVVRRADAEEAAGEEQERVFLRFSGIIGGEELRSMPTAERASRRLVWLSLNVLLSVVAASVILLFEGTIDRLFALVFFIPIVGNLCGCSGNQAVAVSIREMTLGLIQPSDFMRVWFKELTMGLINGTVLGVIVGGVALLLNQLLWHDSPLIALVVGIAFALNSVVAVSLGGLIPLALRAVKADPALAAPPILTTLTDTFGLLLVLALAALALRSGLMDVAAAPSSPVHGAVVEVAGGVSDEAWRQDAGEGSAVAAGPAGSMLRVALAVAPGAPEPLCMLSRLHRLYAGPESRGRGTGTHG